ncbi:MAG: DUF1559 domain-containing protein, partial [Planctomycetota bacterium]
RTRRAGDGAFIVNSRLSDSDFKRGLSNTLGVLETKTYQPYLRNTGVLGMATPDRIDAFQGHSGNFKTTGHTVWTDGRVHHAGVTTTFTPNRVVPYVFDNEFYDIDYTTQQEGNSRSITTTAAVTSRSHHSNVVNVLLMDGSVQTFSDSIDLSAYRQMGRRLEH